MKRHEIYKLLSDQENFKAFILSKSYIQNIDMAISGVVSATELMTLHFIEDLSDEEIARYYNVNPSVIEVWLSKIYLVTEKIIDKNIIRLRS